MKAALSMEGLSPISKSTHDSLDAETKKCWQQVSHSKPPVFIPKGFTMVTDTTNKLHGRAVPSAFHIGLQTGFKVPPGT
jgi:hypothetical protein